MHARGVIDLLASTHSAAASTTSSIVINPTPSPDHQARRGVLAKDHRISFAIQENCGNRDAVACAQALLHDSMPFGVSNADDLSAATRWEARAHLMKSEKHCLSASVEKR